MARYELIVQIRSIVGNKHVAVRERNPAGKPYYGRGRRPEGIDSRSDDRKRSIIICHEKRRSVRSEIARTAELWKLNRLGNRLRTGVHEVDSIGTDHGPITRAAKEGHIVGE